MPKSDHVEAEDDALTPSRDLKITRQLPLTVIEGNPLITPYRKLTSDALQFGRAVRYGFGRADRFGRCREISSRVFGLLRPNQPLRATESPRGDGSKTGFGYHPRTIEKWVSRGRPAAPVCRGG
jgi:hypothetical protein